MTASLLLLSGCNQTTGSGSAGAAASEPERPSFQGRTLHTGPHHTPKGMGGLTIAGYNYTDTYIDSFAVNGAGGGNLSVSDGVAGGGKGTCCASILDDMPLPLTVEISWQRDGDVPRCKQTVLLDGPVPEKPNYLEVHFYQDGSIQLAISDYPSPARVKLERFNRLQRYETGNTNNDGKYSECQRVR